MISFAQNFEDVILWRALKNISAGFYIDIGAQDPVIDSVSRAFHEKGWTGVHVEPSLHYAEKLREDRPGDEIVQAAVGRTEGVLKFFLFPDTGLSTGLEELAREHVERGYRMEEVQSPILTTAQLLDRHADRDIHWMKVDCEGMEGDVIAGWAGSAVRPWIVVLESVEPGTRVPSYASWEPDLLALGYDFVYADGLNRFYVSHQHPELKAAFGPGANCFDDFTLAPFHMVLRNVEREFAAQSGVLASVRAQLSQDLSKVDTLTHERRVLLAGMDQRLDQVSARTGDVTAHVERLGGVVTDAVSALAEQHEAAQKAQAKADKAQARLVEGLEARIADLTAALKSERDALAAQAQLRQALEAQLAEAAGQGGHLRAELTTLRAEANEWRTTADHWLRESREYKESTSWRVTAPLRAVKLLIARALRRQPSLGDPVQAPGAAEPFPQSGPGHGLRHWVGAPEALDRSPLLDRADALFATLKNPRPVASASGERKI